MTISEETLSYAESAFNTETNFSKLLKNDNEVIFRIISDIKMGHELWKKPNPLVPVQEQVAACRYVFRPEDKSKALRLKEPHDDDVAPFLFFCAYFPVKKIIQVVKATHKAVFEDIIAHYRKFQPENIYDFATCKVKKNVIGGQNRYVFEVMTTMDDKFTTQVSRSELPKECVELLKIMPYNLDNIYDKKDAFDMNSD